MIPSMTQSLIYNALLEENWGKIEFTPSFCGEYKIHEFKFEASKEVLASHLYKIIISTFQPLLPTCLQDY